MLLKKNFSCLFHLHTLTAVNSLRPAKSKLIVLPLQR
jgi:hypothetical protein